MAVSPMRADPALSSSGTKQLSARVCYVTNEPAQAVVRVLAEALPGCTRPLMWLRVSQVQGSQTGPRGLA